MPFLDMGLSRNLAQMVLAQRGRAQDLRSRGGAVWIEFRSIPTSELFDGLRTAGFKQAGNTGSFWRK